MKIKTLYPVYGGYVLAKEEGIIFIKGALPDELVEVEIIEKRKDYSIGEVRNVIEPSPFRVEPSCEIADRCGGCQLQHISYDYQVILKAGVLRETLNRIAKINMELNNTVLSEPFGYRYRGQFKSNGIKVGFYREGTRDLISIERCLLMHDRINNFLHFLNRNTLSSLKDVHIITDGNNVVTYFKNTRFKEWTGESFTSDNHINIVFEDHRIGSDSILFEMDEGFSYRISVKSFFQSNWKLNLKLIKRIKEYILHTGLSGRMLDFYAGAGNFTIPLSRYMDEIISVEEESNAYNDLKNNIELNNIKNCKTFNISVERFTPSGVFNLIIIDPPRQGMTDAAIKKIREITPEVILYISCNPSTLARDLKKIYDIYEIESIEMYDFFPNTYHIESLTVLRRKK